MTVLRLEIVVKSQKCYQTLNLSNRTCSISIAAVFADLAAIHFDYSNY
jgi:hypothetical protein